MNVTRLSQHVVQGCLRPRLLYRFPLKDPPAGVGGHPNTDTLSPLHLLTSTWPLSAHPIMAGKRIDEIAEVKQFGRVSFRF